MYDATLRVREVVCRVLARHPERLAAASLHERVCDVMRRPSYRRWLALYRKREAN